MEMSTGNWKKRKYDNDTIIYTSAGGKIAEVSDTVTPKAKGDLSLMVNAKAMFEALTKINELAHNKSKGREEIIKESAQMLKKVHSDYGKLIK